MLHFQHSGWVRDANPLKGHVSCWAAAEITGKMNQENAEKDLDHFSVM